MSTNYYVSFSHNLLVVSVINSTTSQMVIKCVRVKSVGIEANKINFPMLMKFKLLQEDTQVKSSQVKYIYS